MPTYKGAAYVSKTAVGYNQDTGADLVYVETGIPNVIFSRANLWKSIGYDVTTTRIGAYVELRASRTSFSAEFPFIIQWSLSTELIIKPLWSLPKVVDEMDAFPLASGGRAGYKKGIEDAVGNKTALGTAYTGLTGAAGILAELRRGGSGYEYDYIVLKRRTSFDFEFPPSPLALSSIKTIYTTAQLSTNENIPANVLFDMPADPATSQAQALWGWRIRDQTASITNATTGTHETTWVYAQWSTFLYE